MEKYHEKICCRTFEIHQSRIPRSKLGTAVRLTVEENLALAMKRGKTRLLPWCQTTRPNIFKDQLVRLNLGLENRLSSEIGLLSGGQRYYIVATLQRPELILLDEHTAALDPATSKTVMELTEKLITEQNLTAFMVTHDMEDAIRWESTDHAASRKDRRRYPARGKTTLTVPQLLALFKQNSGTALKDDQVLLSS